MKSFITNENNDLFLDGTHSISMGQGINACVQVIQNTLNTLLGEIQLNTTLGIPYFETILGVMPPQVSVWESYMIEAAEAVDNVERVESMQTRQDGDQLNYEMQVLTTFGTVTVN